MKQAREKEGVKAEWIIQPHAEEIFQGLRHPTRVKILFLLLHGEGPLSKGDIAADFSGKHSLALNYHLALMRASGVIEGRRIGHTVFYAVTKNFLSKMQELLSFFASGKEEKARKN